MSTSLFGRLPSGENGDRQGIIQNNPVTRISGRKLQHKRPPTNQFRFKGKRCRYDFPFSCPSKGTTPSKGGREVAVFCPELADNYTRPLGSTDHTGLRNRTVKPSLANQPPFPPCTVSTTDFPSAGRNNKPLTKRGDHRNCFQSLGGILQQPFSCGEEGRKRATPSNQPFQVQQLCGTLPLQDGRLKSSCGSIETRGFHVQTRPEGCLFLGPPSQAVSEIHPLSVPRQDVPIHLSPIRADICPTHLHQNPQTSNRVSKKDGCPDNSLSGRYAHYEQHLRRCQKRHHDFEVNSREFRISNQHGEIHICSCTDHRIPGNHRGLHEHEVSPPRRESCCYSEGVSPIGKQSSHLLKSTFSHNREVNFLQNCSSSSPPSLSGDPTFEEQQHVSPGSQQLKHTFGSSCPRGPQVVGRQSLPCKWTPHSGFPSPSNDSIRCLQFGVGSSEQWGKHPGNMDKRGIQSSYQLQRATSSIICSESIHQGAAKCPCIDSNRQYNNHCLYQQDGGCQKVSPRSLCKTPLGLVSTKTNYSEGRTHSGSPQHNSRQGVTSQTGFFRLAPEPTILSDTNEGSGSMYDRPFCKQNQSSASPVLQLQARPRGRGNRCPNTTVGRIDRVCLSPVQLSSQMPTESDPRGRNNNSSMPCLANTAMVCPTPPTGSSHPHSPSHNRRSLNRTTGSGTPTGEQQNPFACRMEGIRQGLLAKGLSGLSCKRLITNIVLAAQRTSTQNQYKLCWSKWLGWCDKRQINPIQSSIAKVVDFLSELFQAGLQYSTLNSYRSAISSTIPQVEGCPVGQHPLLCKFMKGVFNSRPPQPKYSRAWDVGLVTKYLEGLPSDSDLTVSVLTKKCAMLLALSASKRQSDLRAIDLRFKKCIPEGVSFQLAALTKTRTATKSMEFFFPSFPHSKWLCPVTCLDSYVERTSAWRVFGDGPQPLFLAIQAPQKAVSSATIGRWLKDIMKEAGIDVDTFKAHSTRGAASSAARDRGVSVQDILQTADWTRETTFNRFYYRPKYSNSFGKAVLNGESLL